MNDPRDLSLSSDDEDAPENRPINYKPPWEDLRPYLDVQRFGLDPSASIKADLPAFTDRPAGSSTYVPYWTDLGCQYYFVGFFPNSRSCNYLCYILNSYLQNFLLRYAGESCVSEQLTESRIIGDPQMEVEGDGKRQRPAFGEARFIMRPAILPGDIQKFPTEYAL